MTWAGIAASGERVMWYIIVRHALLPDRYEWLMEEPIILQELESLAAELAIEIYYDDLEESGGGLCRVAGKSRLYIDQSTSVAERIRIMVVELSDLPLEGVFLRPVVRELLESSRRSAAGV